MMVPSTTSTHVCTGGMPYMSWVRIHASGTCVIITNITTVCPAVIVVTECLVPVCKFWLALRNRVKGCVCWWHGWEWLDWRRLLEKIASTSSAAIRVAPTTVPTSCNRWWNQKGLDRRSWKGLDLGGSMMNIVVVVVFSGMVVVHRWKHEVEVHHIVVHQIAYACSWQPNFAWLCSSLTFVVAGCSYFLQNYCAWYCWPLLIARLLLNWPQRPCQN